MKTWQVEPPIDADFMIALERRLPSYSINYEEVINLLARWEREVLNPLTPEEEPFREIFIRSFGSMFLFECGRIYGIRQERARRRRTFPVGSASHSAAINPTEQPTTLPAEV